MRPTRWKMIRALCCLLCLGGVLPLIALPDVAAILNRLPVLDPNAAPFPDSSLVDHSFLLDAPAGKHGFVTVKDGHFAFEDGTRARFYGANIAKDTTFIGKAKIDRIVDVFARAGINLVRIHHIDDASGIIDPTPGSYFRKDKLDLVDYWVAQLKAHGIYVYLDLNDYRNFSADDGVPSADKLGRGARPYSTFNQRLIALQQEYARRFLVEHVNPYTKLSFAQDPAVALVEIHDENGLFIRRHDWQSLAAPYDKELQQHWNAWLRARYKSTAALRLAWTDLNGACAVRDDESLEAASVRLPVMVLPDEQVIPFNDGLRAPVRVNDGALFAYEMQVNWLTGMRAYLREIGVKVPVTAVGAQEVLPDLMATAASTDYIGINYYWDHPGYEWGREWVSRPYYDLCNPITDKQDASFPAVIALSKMARKPLVVRELGYCYPNPYRGVGMIEAAAYAALQDIDALILFTYDALESTNVIGMFDIHLDPVRWGIVSQSSALFLSGALQPARRTVGIGYSLTDAFTWSSYRSALYQLANVTGVANYTDETTPHPFDLLVTSGRSSGCQWRGGKLLLFANARHTDIHYQGWADGVEDQHGYHLTPGPGGERAFTFGGLGYDDGFVRITAPRATFDLADLRAHGLRPVGVGGNVALGFEDPANQVIGFRNLSQLDAVRIAMDALAQWYGVPLAHGDLDRSLMRSDTLQLERDLRAGQLRVDTSTLQAVAGKLAAARPSGTDLLKVATPTPLGVVVAESLDGKPLGESAYYLVKMVSRADNDGVQLTPTPDGPKPFRQDTDGKPPILTGGVATAQPTQVLIDGLTCLQLGLQNGTWEYLVTPERSLLYLDTGNVSVTVARKPQLIRCYGRNQMVERTPDSATFTVPEGTRYVEILWQ